MECLDSEPLTLTQAGVHRKTDKHKQSKSMNDGDAQRLGWLLTRNSTLSLL